MKPTQMKDLSIIDPAVMRQRAEEALRNAPQDVGPLPQDIPKLVHELQVHHVELEMQNHELREAQQALALACDHYTQLYDFSPAGYVTIDAQGVIAEANLRICSMLEVNRKGVLQQPLSAFLSPQDWPIWDRHRQRILDSGVGESCKLRLMPKNGQPLMVHMESRSFHDPETKQDLLQAAILDLTDRERAESAVRESQRKVQEIAAKLITAQEEERRRISRDLHDDYCQRLTAVILEIGMLTRQHPGQWTSPAVHLDPLKTALSGLLSDLRDLSHDLHPNQVASAGLGDALRTYVTKFARKTHIGASFVGEQIPARLPPFISSCLFRIVQECLGNVLKHARAKRVQVTVTGLPEGIELVIKDDGHGFIPEDVDGLHHLGLISIRERVSQLNGTVTITSRPDWGTTVCIQVPWRDEAEEEPAPAGS